MLESPARVKTTVFKLRTLFMTMALVLLGSIIITFLAGRRVLLARDEVQQHDDVLAQIRSTFSAIQDAETGQRGYLLTSEPSYLQPYKDAVSVIPRNLAGLKELADLGLLSRKSVEEFEELNRKKLTELQETVDLAKNGRTEAALNIVRNDSGKNIMDSIRSLFASLKLEQENARAAAHASDVRATWVRTATFVFTAAINLGFLFWAYKRIRREMSLQYVAALETERQREILAVTLASIGDAVIITDTTGRITFTNEVAAELTGWTQEEAKGQPCARVFQIINEHTREPVASPVDKVLSTGAIVGLANHTLLIRKDGRELPIDDSGAPIREQDGSVRGVVLVFRDFTTYKEAERNLIASKQKVEEASKAKDKFLAMLSHELRTPLTPVLATLSAWEARCALPEPLHPDLKLLRRNIEMEVRLINDLLDITRITHGKLFLEKEAVNAHALLAAAADLFRPQCAENGVELSISTRAAQPFVHGDPARLQQVFWNIIGNAAKFTSRGDRINISTADLPEARLRIEISDTGIGMTEETLGGLFQSFHQGDAPPKKSRGLGLGLSISHALVEAHGGRLEAASEGPSKGSTFSIILPTIPEPATNTPAPQPRPSSTGGRRILLVEDHDDTAHVLTQVIRSMGHAVETCATVAAGREKIRDGKYDLILSDIGLPDSTGIEFIQSVRPACATPAVALTGYGTSDDVENCLAAGFNDHLTKPIDFEELQAVLQKYL